MRAFLYRISWDKQYLKRSLLVSACSIFAVFVVAFAVIGVYHYRMFLISDEELDSEEIDRGPVYDLIFGHQENQDEPQESYNEDTQNNEDTRPQQNNTQSFIGNSESHSSQQAEQPQGMHVHSWFKVIDSAAWTEHISVHIGYQYRCNNCGYTTNSASLISSHCSRLSHSFYQSPIHEDKTIYHSEVSHMECDCGARK